MAWSIVMAWSQEVKGIFFRNCSASLAPSSAAGAGKTPKTKASIKAISPIPKNLASAIVLINPSLIEKVQNKKPNFTFCDLDDVTLGSSAIFGIGRRQIRENQLQESNESI